MILYTSFWSRFLIEPFLFACHIVHMYYNFCVLTCFLLGTVKAGMAPGGSQFDAKHYGSKMQELL
jgi:hypothetical protein